MRKKEGLLWKLSMLFVILTGVTTLADFAGIDIFKKYVWFKLFTYLLPVIILFLHSRLTLTPKRALSFFILAAIVGTLFEYIGLKYGTIFGGTYVYESPLTLFTVPIDVVIYWAVFIYTGYSITNSFLYWLRQKKPNFKRKHFLLLLFEILCDGLILVSLDLFLDPVIIKTGAWRWIEGGPYFGVPIGNFIGWFIVTIIVTGAFRLFEYYFPRREAIYHKSIFIIPVLFYGVLALSFCFKALFYHMNTVALVGSLFMFPIVIVNLYFFEEYEEQCK